MGMIVPYAISSYTVIIYEAAEGGYWGEILELPGCVSQGETIEEFRRNIMEALEVILEAESQAPHSVVYAESTMSEKEVKQFWMPEPDNEKKNGVEVNNSWTAV